MFPLLRYFSLTSAAVLVAATLLLAGLYRYAAIDRLVDHGQTANVALAGALANSIWPRFKGHVTMVTGLDGDALRAHPETKRLRETVLEHLRGLSVIKVKIYDEKGLTVFSTEPSQIGDDKSDNAGFLSAYSGQVASELTHRDSFSAFENTVEDRDVISSYIPIHGAGGRIDGVFEIYDDVTPLLAKIERTQIWVAAVSVAILVILYLVLLIIVRRADGQLKRQHQAIRAHNDGLEAAVEERTAQLAAALETEQQYNMLQREFVTMVSYEFRTPLSIIDATAHRVERQATSLTPSDLGERMGTIRDAVVRMTGLIESSTNMTKIDAGQIEVKHLSIEPRQLINQVIERQSHINAEAKVAVSLDLPTTIIGDPQLLDQIFTNLLSNAVKYSPHNPNQIEVMGRTEGDAIVIEVRDHGLGISDADLPQIFDRYFRAQANIGIAGTGIGLTLVKQFVELHGGSIAIDSVEGYGSKFTVRLPLVVPAALAETG